MDFSESIAIIEEIKNKEVAIPISYQRAVTAIQECHALDEAKDWTDKMSALALYYKQSKDETLEKYAKRIKYRAKRRMGELLKQYDARGGDHGNQYKSKSGKKVVSDLFATQKELAQSIGLSERQQKEAVSFANVPEKKFEELIESDNIPNQSEISELGKNKRKSKPNNYSKVLSVKYAIKDLIKEMNDKDAIYVLDALDEDNKKEMLDMIKTVENWFDTFVVNCNIE